MHSLFLIEFLAISPLYNLAILFKKRFYSLDQNLKLMEQRLILAFNSGCGAVRQRTKLGAWGSQVQILSSRHSKGCLKRGSLFFHMYTVYILYSPSLNQFYKGQTSNIDNRLIRHNSGYEKFTSESFIRSSPKFIYLLRVFRIR